MKKAYHGDTENTEILTEQKRSDILFSVNASVPSVSPW
jgi:hypothetical protein